MSASQLKGELEDFRCQPTHATSTYTKLPGITVTVGDESVKTPTASPNNSFNEEEQNMMDISPSLRNLVPGYVSNLAGFWSMKV